MISSITLFAAIALLQAITAPLTPQGDWKLDPTPGMCVAQRSYSSGELMLGLRLYADAQHHDLIVTDGIDKTNMGSWKTAARLTLLPGGRVIESLAESSLVNGVHVTHFGSIPKQLEGFDDAAAIVVDAAGASRTYGIDRLKEARELLRQCQEALVRSWGIDPARFHPLGTPRAGAGFFSGPEAYPQAALRAEEQGRVGVLIEIPASGRIVNCRVVETSHSDSLDDATCNLVRDKFVFTPAQDETGKPTASWTVVAMRWVLPQE